MEAPQKPPRKPFREYPLIDRKNMAQLLMQKSPGNVPVIIEKDTRSKLNFQHIMLSKKDFVPT